MAFFRRHHDERRPEPGRSPLQRRQPRRFDAVVVGCRPLTHRTASERLADQLLLTAILATRALPEQGNELLATAVEMAKNGDTTMLSFLINRILPASKPETAPTEIALPAGSLTEQATAVVNAAASGALSASTAGELLAGLGVVGRLTELDEITKRLTALEARSGGGQ